MRYAVGLWLVWSVVVASYVSYVLFVLPPPHYEHGISLFSLVTLEGGGILGLLGAWGFSRELRRSGGLLVLCALSGGVTPGGGFLAFALTVGLAIAFAVVSGLAARSD